MTLGPMQNENVPATAAELRAKVAEFLFCLFLCNLLLRYLDSQSEFCLIFLPFIAVIFRFLN